VSTVLRVLADAGPPLFALIAVSLAGGAAWLAFPPAQERALTRLRAPVTSPRSAAETRQGTGAEPTGVLSSPMARWGAVTVAGLALVLLSAPLLTPPVAIILAAVAGALLLRLLSRIRAPRQHPDLARGVPALAELLAACLAAGASTRRALAAVDPALTATHPALAEELRTLARRLDLGEDPARAWTTLAGRHPALQPLAMTVAWAADTGAPLAGTLSRQAEAQRQQQRLRVIAAARAAGVWLVLPLGLCFLPAFLLVGIVPVVASLLTVLF